MDKVEDITTAAIAAIPETEEFLRFNERQNLSAFDIFCLLFYNIFRLLSSAQQNVYIRSPLRHEMDVDEENSGGLNYDEHNDICDDDDNDTDDEVDDDVKDGAYTARERSAMALQNMILRSRKLSKVWNYVGSTRKRAFNEKAKKMDKLPVSGMLITLPSFFRTLVSDSLDKLIILCLYYDYKYLCKKMIAALKKGSSKFKAEQERTYRFRHEHCVRVDTKISRRGFEIPSLLKMLIFGPVYPGLLGMNTKLRYDEIVYKRSKRIVINIASHSRLDSIFNIQNMRGCYFRKNGLRYMGCGKLTIYIKGPRYKAGETKSYIIDEETDNKNIRWWHLLCPKRDSSISILKVPSFSFNHETNTYEWASSYIYNNISFEVVDYDPVRIVINTKQPQVHFMMHRVVLNDHNNINASIENMKIVASLST